ncbi:PorT family protein [Reichenbachiella carrageenanivorans]|uniref:PorT family protein n=1 Tax=Reichenbachiella carrageenanivorans TaxID=2979869 RepID=A0ABY6D8L8_9BACT|nr:PorT family protein [Reichenbachiella carrageenanivorans]UXX80225.1 PorT family protein [Reichenbachiella carrageenanivorans]
MMKKIIFALFACLLLTAGHFAKAQLTEEVKKKTPELPGQIMVDFGFNSSSNNPSSMPYHWWRSKSLGLYFVKSFEFSKKLELRPGIGVSLEKFGHAENMDVFSYGEDSNGADTLGFSTVLGGGLKKNQLAVNYIEMPIEVRFNLNGNEKKDGIFLAIGGSAAYRFESHTKIKYTDEFGNKMKDKQKNNFGLNNIRLGAYGRLGYRSFSVFYKTYFTNVFSSDGPIGSENMLYSTIGISLTGL